MIRLILPSDLRNLPHLDREVTLEVPGTVISGKESLIISGAIAGGYPARGHVSSTA